MTLNHSTPEFRTPATRRKMGKGPATHGARAGLSFTSLKAGLRKAKKISDALDDCWIGDVIGVLCLGLMLWGALFLAAVFG